jgi:protein gp37
MAENSKIEWTDHTFNPWIGCTKVSPGCDNCYAATQDNFRKWTPEGWGGPRKRTKTWGDPIKWNKRAEALGKREKVFCASLSDWADNSVPPAWRAELFAVAGLTPWLDYLMLTKRIGNVAAMLAAPGMPKTLPPNIRIGATMVNQKEWDRDIGKLLALGVPNFVSLEPLLGAIDMRGKRPDWVIVGGESGPGARPMHPAWVRGLRDQCNAAGVKFLFKQWGEWVPRSDCYHTFADGTSCADLDPSCKRWPNVIRLTDAGHDGSRLENVNGGDDAYMQRVGKSFAGRLLDGVTHDGYPLEAA